MASSIEQTFTYLVSEIYKKTQSALHHQHGNIWHLSQICAQITDLILRSQALSLNTEINHDTKSILISPQQSLQLINETVANLLNSDANPGIQTLKMQFTLSAMTKESDVETSKKIECHRKEFDEKSREISKNIPYNNSTMKKLYNDLFALLCFNERYVENKKENEEIDRISEREMTAALENVFPRSQIKEYKRLSNENKVLRIKELIDIIYGIRLYDKDVGKGGSSIADMSKLIEMDLSELYNEINEKMQSVQIEIENYTKIIELEYTKPGTITTPLLSMQSEIRNRFQFGAYLKRFKDEIIQSTEILHTINKKFADELKSLHLLFKSEQHPLKKLVYPKFAQLSIFRKLMIVEKYCNQSRKAIFQVLKQFDSAFKSSLNEKDIELIILSQHEKNQNDNFIPFHTIKALNPNIMQIDHNISNPNDIKYNGFCLVSLTNKNGMLFKADRRQTLIQLNANKYCFYSPAELKEFASSPQKYYDALTEILIKYPELLNILGLNDIKNAPAAITNIQLNSMLPTGAMINVPRKISQGVGTPTHFMEENIVAGYSWNEWDLRRRALQIVNMRLKKIRTHSTQTDLSHYRRENATQYYLKQALADGTMPGKETQTGIERGTHVAKQKKFITGLRGKPNETVSFLTLTFDPPIKRMN